jgi:hypothetical protein
MAAVFSSGFLPKPLFAKIVQASGALPPAGAFALFPTVREIELEARWLRERQGFLKI